MTAFRIILLLLLLRICYIYILCIILRRKKGNGSNSDGQSTENCTVMDMRVFGDFHIIIKVYILKYIATPLHQYDYYYHIYSII